MYTPTEQIAEINKAGYQNAVKLAELSLDKAERLTKLNLQVAKVVLEQGAFTANAVAGIKDVQGLAAVRAKLTEAGVQNILGYSRGVYQIASEAQADFSALAEQAWAGYTKTVAAWVEQAAKHAPAGSDVAVTALKSTVAATTAAFDQFSKATKQVVSFADASMRAAATNAANVAKATANAPASKGRKAA
jgi:phasin family protein